MSLPNYFSAVAWIAEHDGKDGMGALQPPAVASRPTVALLAEMYGRRREAVAADVVACRTTARETARAFLTRAALAGRTPPEMSGMVDDALAALKDWKTP